MSEIVASKEKDIAESVKSVVGEDWLANEPLWKRILVQSLRIFGTMLGLYFFLVSLSLMGDALTALTGKGAGSLFNAVDNPIVGLMVGIIATVLVQSSSTTTSIIVVLVGSQVIPVTNAVPMIMGANIGTSVTNTIVSLGFVDDAEAYERGFAGATVHDMFNYLCVLVLLPLELFVGLFTDGKGGILQLLGESIAKGRGEGELEAGDDFKDANPIKKITNPILDFLIEINKDVVADHALSFPSKEGFVDTENCTEDLFFQFESEESGVDVIGCEEFNCDFCENGVFNETLFDLAKKAFDEEELISGGIFESFGDVGGGVSALILSLVLLILSLTLIVKMLGILIQGAAERILVKSLNHNYRGGEYVSILLGVAITFVVQSSSITTSILTPLVAMGTLSLESMFPYTLGANIGTTGTGLIAAAADGDPDGYAIALVHFFFNIIGTLLFFPIPRVRQLPLNAARFLGSMAAIWKVVPMIYIVMAFLVYPMIVFGLSAGFSSKNAGGIVVSSLFTLVLVALHGYAFYFYKFKDGKEKFKAFVERRKEKLEKSRESKEEI